MKTSIKFVTEAAIVCLVLALALCVSEAMLTLNHHRFPEVDALMLGKQNHKQVQEKPKLNLKHIKNKRCVALVRQAGKAGICAAVAMGAELTAKYGPACSNAQTHVSALQVSDQEQIQNSLNLPKVSLDKGTSNLLRTPLFASTTTMTQSSTSTQTGTGSSSQQPSSRSSGKSTRSSTQSKSSSDSKSTTRSKSTKTKSSGSEKSKSDTKSTDSSTSKKTKSSSSSDDDSCADGVLVEFNLPKGLTTEQIAENCYLMENSFRILTCGDAYKSVSSGQEDQDTDSSSQKLRPILEEDKLVKEVEASNSDSDTYDGYKLKPYSTCSKELLEVENYVLQLGDAYGDGWLCDLCPNYYAAGGDYDQECKYDEEDRYVYPTLSLSTRLNQNKNGLLIQKIYTMRRGPLVTPEEQMQMHYNQQESYIVSSGDKANEKCSSDYITTDCQKQLFRSDDEKLQKFHSETSENGLLGNGKCNDNALSLDPEYQRDNVPFLNCAKFNYDEGDCINGDCLGEANGTMFTYSRYPAFSIRKSKEMESEDGNDYGNDRDTEGELPFPEYSPHGWIGDGFCDAVRYQEDVGMLADPACDRWSLDGGDCMVACNGLVFESEYGVYKGNTPKSKAGRLANGICDNKGLNLNPVPDGRIDFRKTDNPNLNCAQYDYDGGDCMKDCNGVYFDRQRYGDGECDEGDSSVVGHDGKTLKPDLNCAELEFDDGDCLDDGDGGMR